MEEWGILTTGGVRKRSGRSDGNRLDVVVPRRVRTISCKDNLTFNNSGDCPIAAQQSILQQTNHQTRGKSRTLAVENGGVVDHNARARVHLVRRLLCQQNTSDMSVKPRHLRTGFTIKFRSHDVRTQSIVVARSRQQNQRWKRVSPYMKVTEL